MDYIYLIQNGDTRLFKIGVSNKPKRRIKSLQTGNPLTLTLVCTIACVNVPAYRAEAIIHNHLKKHRVGGEWFSLTNDQIIRLVRVMQATFGASIDVVFEQTKSRWRKSSHVPGITLARR